MTLKHTTQCKCAKGQSIIEYLLLITAVIVILLVFFVKGGAFQKTYDAVIKRQGDDMLNIALNIFPAP